MLVSSNWKGEDYLYNLFAGEELKKKKSDAKFIISNDNWVNIAENSRFFQICENW